MNLELYSIFLVTTVMLIFVPGPAAITVAAQGASHSSNKAFLGVLGVASADVAFFVLSATGIASLILASNLLFSIIKWFWCCIFVVSRCHCFIQQSGSYKNQQQGR